MIEYLNVEFSKHTNYHLRTTNQQFNHLTIQQSTFNAHPPHVAYKSHDPVFY
jgi:hypothetical protein